MTITSTFIILLDLRKLIMLATTPLLLSSCSPVNERKEQGQPLIDSRPSYFTAQTDTLPELTPEQQSAFDALDTLQVSTDEENRLYSTFAGIVQPYYLPDTSLTISQAELLIAIKEFLTKHCSNLSIKKRNELAATAVLAQKEYIVLYCSNNSSLTSEEQIALQYLKHSSNVNSENGLPMTGTWVMPSVLGRRDVILVW